MKQGVAAVTPSCFIYSKVGFSIQIPQKSNIPKIKIPPWQSCK